MGVFYTCKKRLETTRSHREISPTLARSQTLKRPGSRHVSQRWTQHYSILMQESYSAPFHSDTIECIYRHRAQPALAIPEFPLSGVCFFVEPARSTRFKQKCRDIKAAQCAASFLPEIQQRLLFRTRCVSENVRDHLLCRHTGTLTGIQQCVHHTR